MTSAESGMARSTRILHIVIPDEVRGAVGRAFAEIPNPEHACDLASVIARKAFCLLPDAQLGLLLDFGRHVDMPGVALVENLPLDADLPPTPADGGPCQDKPGYVAEGVLMGLSGLLGEPVSFTTEKGGRIVHDIVPTRAGAATQTSQSSVVTLSFHNDIVHDERGRYDISNPDFLVLNCLRADPDAAAKTYYADARDILGALEPEVVRTLRSPEFRLNAPGGYTQLYADPAIMAAGLLATRQARAHDRDPDPRKLHPHPGLPRPRTGAARAAAAERLSLGHHRSAGHPEAARYRARGGLPGPGQARVPGSARHRRGHGAGRAERDRGR